MTNEEREKKTKIANMLIETIKDLRTPMLMYQVEKDVTKEALENYIKALKQQPTRTTGKWIVCDVVKFGDFVGTEKYECSKCHHRVGAFKSNFCPNCGAKMDGVETEVEDER